MYAKVREHKDIVRDQHSKALLTVDVQALESHRRARRDRQRLDDVERKVDEIGQDISAIKSMLMAIIPGGRVE